MVKLQLFFNKENEVDISGLNIKSTVQDFFDAIDEFLTENPLPCDTCKQHCCKGRFKINMDSISAKKISKGKVERIIPKLFVDAGQNKLEVYFVAGNKKCRHLDGLARCLIYKERPASCRTYVCIPQSPCYKILDAAIVAEMHHAMRAEYLDAVIADPATPPGAIEPAKTLRQEIISNSIAYGYNNYSEILIKDCVRADLAHSNVSQEEVRLFYETIKNQ
ncbi:MAG TPA: YkgJ family cysteine cluster protein [Methylomusa anaerophila]|uniref:Flagellin N-methylase n=1 Tax=Methylomusa anaerophila TaxID=1930071 RepID=A0A348ALA4_9FIRM|nr:YkgJ family cysteine cluster protein [Methylomusa anaerophila]BBB91852.1 flagellin N-methylase [Methylomusa anaerophila]HML88415.1 YkgJ family cysteine cluster protein [Methylomusa anaerophila]